MKAPHTHNALLKVSPLQGNNLSGFELECLRLETNFYSKFKVVPLSVEGLVQSKIRIEDLSPFRNALGGVANRNIMSDFWLRFDQSYGFLQLFVENNHHTLRYEGHGYGNRLGASRGDSHPLYGFAIF